MKTIKIIARYADFSGAIKPIAPAAKNKIDYVINSLIKSGFCVDVFSLCTISLNKKIINKTVQRINDKLEIHYLTCFENKTIFSKILHRIIDPARVFLQLMRNIKKTDTIIVYHNLSFLRTLYFVKNIKKFKLILEVEEIYGMVSQDSKEIKKEFKYFEKADAYLFPTQLLEKKINKTDKPSLIVHGSYEVIENIVRKYDDGRIHCVYAGTFDQRKGGANIAIKSALYLNEKYHLHIIGFGSKEDTDLVMRQIEMVKKKAQCIITYDGLKTGSAYFEFIQKCDLGLSTQNPDAPFNDTSFPSKILSYMGNGLRVLTIRIPVVEMSAVGDAVYYYDRPDPINIANSIMSIDFLKEYDSRYVIKELDKSFRVEISKMVKSS